MTDLAGSPDEHAAGEVEITVENVGGIDRRDLSISPGVNVLAGRNATNRTSMLTAIRGTLGGSTASLKSDADVGHVFMEFGGETFSTHYTRTSEGVRTERKTFTEDNEPVNLFVSLLEDNPTRQAVERGDDLREIIMRPVDTEAIESRIQALRTEIAELDEEIDRVERRRDELPALEDRRHTLEDEISALDDDISDLREDISEAEREMKAEDEASGVIDALEDRRTDRNDIANELEVKRAEQDALREEIVDIEEKLDSLDDVSNDDVETAERNLQGLRERKKEIDEIVTSLTSILEVNKELLDEDRSLPDIEADDGDVTSQLVGDATREVNCWTCGSRVEATLIENRLEDIRELVREKRSDRQELSKAIDDLRKRITELNDLISRRDSLEERLDRARMNLESIEADIASLEADLEDCEDEIADLQEQLAEAEDERADDFSKNYEEISDYEFERGRLQRELEEVQAEVEKIEALPDEDTLEEQRKELRSELEDMQDRISSLESTAVDAFNTHMDELLNVLGYENIARVWLERKYVESSRSTDFDLHVVRESSESAAYEDVLANLSESEREVVGLVVALAGYLVHEVYETVPFMLLDSLESIDAERISLLVEYFSEFADYLIVALLPEDAATLKNQHQDINSANFG